MKKVEITKKELASKIAQLTGYSALHVAQVLSGRRENETISGVATLLSKPIKQATLVSLRKKLQRGDMNIIAAKTGFSVSHVSHVFAGTRNNPDRTIFVAAKIVAQGHKA